MIQFVSSCCIWIYAFRFVYSDSLYFDLCIQIRVCRFVYADLCVQIYCISIRMFGFIYVFRFVYSDLSI